MLLVGCVKSVRLEKSRIPPTQRVRPVLRGLKRRWIRAAAPDVTLGGCDQVVLSAYHVLLDKCKIKTSLPVLRVHREPSPLPTSRFADSVVEQRIQEWGQHAYSVLLHLLSTLRTPRARSVRRVQDPI